MTREDSDLIDVLTAHEVTEPRAWAAALELEVERERQGSAIDRLIDHHGDQLLDLAGAMVLGSMPGAAGVDPVAATDGGSNPTRSTRRPRGSPQRRKFVDEAAQAGREPDRGAGAGDRSDGEPDPLTDESEREVSK